MSYVVLTIVCLIIYVAGMVILVRVTPRLLGHAYDESAFTLFAIADIFGGLFVFGAVAITFGLFSGSFAVKLLDFLLLVGIFFVAAHLLYRSLRPHRLGTIRASRIIAGLYCLLLVVAALYSLALLLI